MISVIGWSFCVAAMWTESRSIATPQSTTIVSLYNAGAVPFQLPSCEWEVDVLIKTQKFVCRPSSNPEVSRKQFRMYKLKSQLAPLAGTCIEHEKQGGFVTQTVGNSLEASEPSHEAELYRNSLVAYRICPNEQITVTGDDSDGIRRTRTYRLPDARSMTRFSSEDATQSWVQPYTSESRQVNLICNHTEYVSPESRRICRIGDPVNVHEVILHTTRIPDGTILASVRSTRSDGKRTLLLTQLSGGEGSVCESDGNLNTTDLLTVEKTEESAEDRIDVFVKSPLCRKEVGSDPPISLLAPIAGGCFVAPFNNRQFEYCHFDDFPIFRIVQHRDRAHHKWPVSVTMASKERVSWELGSRIKSIRSNALNTGLSCAGIQPALSELYSVVYKGRRVAGIGGSFMPFMWSTTTSGEENVSGLTGMIVYDFKHASGCSADAFVSLIPPQPQKWIAVMDRGECMFHEKGRLAQEKGASGVVIINTLKRAMISALAGMPDKPVLDIPVVMVDRDGEFLKKLNGEMVSIESNFDKYFPASRSTKSSSLVRGDLKINVEFVCDAKWNTDSLFAKSCEVGHQVGVIREGDMGQLVGKIEKVNFDTFKVDVGGMGIATYQGWQLSKDPHTLCTAQLGTMITDISRSEENPCEIDVTIHSGFLCGDSRFREPPKIVNDIHCEMVTDEVFEKNNDSVDT